MLEQKIKYVVKRKGKKIYWVDNKNDFLPEINNARSYPINEKLCDNEELVAIHPDGKLEVVRVG